MDGQVCYQADVAKDKIRDKVDKRKIATEGFVMLLDYNENRMVKLGEASLKKRENLGLNPKGGGG